MEQLRPFRKAWLDAANALEELAKPVVCKIQGGCIGGALETALACDLRVMADRRHHRAARDAHRPDPRRRRLVAAAAGGRPGPGQGADPDRAADRRRGGRAHRPGQPRRARRGARRRRRRSWSTSCCSARRWRSAWPSGSSTPAPGRRCPPRWSSRSRCRRCAPPREDFAEGATGVRGEAPAELRRPLICVLAGGTGGAKLARGIDALGEELVVVANTGDDIEIYDARVSPDPDLILFWLADRIDARGWGIEGDTFHAMDRAASEARMWFNLGDEDLAICRERLAPAARGRTPDRGHRRAARAARRAPARAADVRRAGAHHRRRRPVPGVDDPARRHARDGARPAEARSRRRSRTRWRPPTR